MQKCVVCSTGLVAAAPFYGMPTTQGIQCVCVPCYEENGGKKHGVVRVNGNPFEENPRHRARQHVKRVPRGARLDIDIPWHPVVHQTRRRYLTPEEHGLRVMLTDENPNRGEFIRMRRWQGNPFIECGECGALIGKKGERHKKYCPIGHLHHELYKENERDYEKNQNICPGYLSPNCTRTIVAVWYEPANVFAGLHQTTQPRPACRYHAQKAETLGYEVEWKTYESNIPPRYKRRQDNPHYQLYSPERYPRGRNVMLDSADTPGHVGPFELREEREYEENALLTGLQKFMGDIEKCHKCGKDTNTRYQNKPVCDNCAEKIRADIQQAYTAGGGTEHEENIPPRYMSKSRSAELRKKLGTPGMRVRPPREWWDGIQKSLRKQYPRHSKERLGQIAGGIWHRRYTAKQRKGIVQRLAKGTGGVPARRR